MIVSLGPKLTALDNKLRSMEPIIRYLFVNVEDQEKRAAKDKTVQDAMRATRKPQKVEGAVAQEPEVKLTETELESKIEKALESEDLGK